MSGTVETFCAFKGTVLGTLFQQRFCGRRCVTHCRPWGLFWGPSHIDCGTNECIFIHFCNGFGWKRNCCKNALRIVSARSQSDLAKLAAMVLNAYDAATLRAADTSHQCGSEWGLRTQPHHHSFTRCGQQWHTSTMDFLGPCSGPDNGPRFGPRGSKTGPELVPETRPTKRRFFQQKIKKCAPDVAPRPA